MRFKRLLSSIAIGAMLSTASPAYADSVSLPPAPSLVVGEPDVGAAISPMKKGQTAPFTGILLSPMASATITVEMSHAKDQTKIEVDHANAIAGAQCDAKTNADKIQAEADAKVASAKLDASMKENKIVSDRLARVESSQPNLLLWVGGGFLVGIVVSVATTYAVTQATK